MTATVRLEFFVEPFAEGQPGTHVTAAVEAARARGLDVEVGPFGSTTAGTLDSLSTAVGDVVRAAIENGATRVSLQAVADGPGSVTHVGDLRNALDHMIEQVEARHGTRLVDMSRTEKQAAVRELDRQGAFSLRKAIEAVADAMGVSRITIYNYLNAIPEE